MESKDEKKAPLPKAKKVRADLAVVAAGLCVSLQKARALILAGAVLADDKPVNKAGDLLSGDASLRLRREILPFVSRGGLKLQGALERFSIDVSGKVAVDVGASSGGFTDCLLQSGAARVYDIDVGRGQLDPRIARDDRVVVIDRTNIRHMPPEILPELCDLAVIDVSFISLNKVLPAVMALLKEDAFVVSLVKPQFEVGRAQVGKGGIVRDEVARQQALQEVVGFAAGLGLIEKGRMESPIQGAKGNIEYLLWLQRG